MGDNLERWINGVATAHGNQEARMIARRGPRHLGFNAEETARRRDLKSIARIHRDRHQVTV
jgi:hypothetical protein